MGRSDTGMTTGWTEGDIPPVGRSHARVTTGWTEGKPWEIAWGELLWEGAIRE